MKVEQFCDGGVAKTLRTSILIGTVFTWGVKGYHFLRVAANTYVCLEDNTLWDNTYVPEMLEGYESFPNAKIVLK